MNLTKKEKEVLIGFADNNMNCSETARSLHMHRNTVYYNLGKVKEKTGLCPENFYDLVELIDFVKADGMDGKQTY